MWKGIDGIREGEIYFEMAASLSEKYEMVLWRNENLGDTYHDTTLVSDVLLGIMKSSESAPVISRSQLIPALHFSQGCGGWEIRITPGKYLQHPSCLGPTPSSVFRYTILKHGVFGQQQQVHAQRDKRDKCHNGSHQIIHFQFTVPVTHYRF